MGPSVTNCPISPSFVVLPADLFYIIQWMMASNWRDRPTVDQLLAFPRLRDGWRARRKWAIVNYLVSSGWSVGFPSVHFQYESPLLPLQKKCRRNSIHLAWQKWSSLKNRLLQLLLVITAFFKLRHVKDPATGADDDAEEMAMEQTTPKCNQSVLLARLDAINQSVTSAMDDSSDSALGVAPHPPDGRRSELLPEGLLDPATTMYSSTPIIHGGLNLRRSRLQTPNSPM